MPSQSRIGSSVSDAGFIVGDNYGWVWMQNYGTGKWGQTSAYANVSGNNLRVNNYGFTIPSGAIITGIELLLYRYQNGNYGCVDQHVRLMKTSGAVVGSNKADTVNEMSLQENASHSYGGVGDLWGTTWTADEINSTTFGMLYATIHKYGSNALRFMWTAGNLSNYPSTQITVYYEIGGGSHMIL